MNIFNKYLTSILMYDVCFFREQKEAENLKDANASIEELSLMDDDSVFPYPYKSHVQ